MIPSFSTNAFTHFSLEDSLQELAKLGFAGVEILADQPHMVPGEWRPKDSAHLAQLLDKLKLTCVNLNANTAEFKEGSHPFRPSLGSLDPQERQERIEIVRQLIPIAQDLSCPQVCVSAGPAADCDHEMLVESLKRLGDEYAEADLKLAFEFEPEHLIENTEQALALVEAVKPSPLFLNYDIGHAWCADDPLPERLDQAQPYITSFHLEDIKDKVHQHLLPGEGDIPLADLVKHIASWSFAGPLIFELYPYKSEPVKAAEAAMIFLKEKL